MDTNFIVPLDNFVSEAIAELPDYLSQENNKKFLTIFLQRWKELEDIIIDVAEYRLLANAEGVILDEIGEQQNIYRNGMTDTEYRTVILIRQSSYGKSGTRPEVSEVLDALFSSTNWYMYKGTDYRVDVVASTPCMDLSTVVEDITEIFPVITELRIIESSPYSDCFGFDGDDNAFGFCSVDDRTERQAGALGGVVYTTQQAIHG